MSRHLADGPFRYFARTHPLSAWYILSRTTCLNGIVRDIYLRPGRFPQRADDHPDPPGRRGNRRPEPELEVPLRFAAPAAAYALMLSARVIHGPHLKAGCDHRPVLASHSGMPV